MPDHCLNCQADLAGNFCSNCGQKASTRRITWKWLGDEVVNSVFVVHRGILFTIKELFTRPGHTIREYLEGKRIRHFRPLAFVLLTAAVFSLLSPWMQPDYLNVLDPVQKRTLDVMSGFMADYYALVELALVPVFSLCTWIFFGRYGNNFVEHLVLQSFLSGQRIILNIVALPFNLLGFQASLLATSVLSVGYVLTLLFCFVQFYQDRPAVGVLFRAIGSIVLFFLLLTVLAVTGGILFEMYWRA